MSRQHPEMSESCSNFEPHLIVDNVVQFLRVFYGQHPKIWIALAGSLARDLHVAGVRENKKLYDQQFEQQNVTAVRVSAVVAMG